MPQHHHQYCASVLGLLNQDLGGVFLSYYVCLPHRLFENVALPLCVYVAVFMSQSRWGSGEPCGSVEWGGVTSESDLRCQFEIDVWPWHCQLKIPSHTQLCWHPRIQKYTHHSLSKRLTPIQEFWDGFLCTLTEFEGSVTVCVSIYCHTHTITVFYALPSLIRGQIGLCFVLSKSSYEMYGVYMFILSTLEIIRSHDLCVWVHTPLYLCAV